MGVFNCNTVRHFVFWRQGDGEGEERERRNNQCFLNLLYHELPCLGWHVLMFPISIPRVGMLAN